MHLLTHLDIEKVCNYIKNTMPAYYTAQRICTQVMYQTGCRAKESFKLELWERFSTDTIILHPQKGNDARFFLANDVPAQFVFLIDNNQAYFEGFTYRKLEYAINLLIKNFGIHIDSKDSVCHLFRHNYVKKLIDAGQDASQIKTALGERTMKATESYLNSQVTARQWIPNFFD